MNTAIPGPRLSDVSWPAVTACIPSGADQNTVRGHGLVAGNFVLAHDRVARMAEVAVSAVSALEYVLYHHLRTPASIADYLELPGGEDWATLLVNSACFGIGSTRCDMVQHGGAWKVLEINATNAGGWISSRTLGTRATAGAWSYRETYAHAIDTTAVLLQHLLDEALRKAIAIAGEPLRVGFIVSGRSGGEFDDTFLQHCNDALNSAAISDPRLHTLQIEFVDWADLHFNSAGVQHAGRRIHILFETEIVECSGRLLAAHAACQMKVLLVSGPFAQIANDKRLFAMLSELADDSSKRLPAINNIGGIVPWTRVMRDGCTLRNGARVQLPEFVYRQKDSLVLKRALSSGGADVFIGHATPDEAWEHLVATSLAERDWIVQEWVEPDREPEIALNSPHHRGIHIVWGAFVIGGFFAGGFARVLDTNGYRSAATPGQRPERNAISFSPNADDCIATFPICWRNAHSHSMTSLVERPFQE